MLGSAFISQYQWLGFWRVITVLGVGGILVGTNVITSEYSSRKWRSFAISVYAAGFGIGAVLGGMFAVMLQGEYGWRSVFLAGAILTALLLVVLFIWLPESIDFLTSKQPKNAEVRLNLIAKKIGEKPINCVGLGNAQWVAIDYADVIVHIFTPETREFYDIEHLWV